MIHPQHNNITINNLDVHQSIDFLNLPEENIRFEIKYLCNLNDYPKILNVLNQNFALINFYGQTKQHYDSLYFDTPNFKDYHQHHRGAFPRSKTRIRTYLNNKEYFRFFELKQKFANGKSNKTRIQIQDNFVLNLPENYVESLNVTYDRIQFWDFEENVRMTIDQNISFKNCKEKTLEAITIKDYFILEIKKTSAKRCKMEKLLHAMAIQPSSLSKYCLGIAITQQEVKKNKYKSLLKKIEKN